MYHVDYSKDRVVAQADKRQLHAEESQLLKVRFLVDEVALEQFFPSSDGVPANHHSTIASF
jgi:hypothetical protein